MAAGLTVFCPAALWDHPEIRRLEYSRTVKSSVVEARQAFFLIPQNETGAMHKKRRIRMDLK